jgi:membrane protein required for colicin V production
MSFTWPDIALGAVMLISGLMAIMRGLSREVLSLVAWGAAAVAAFYAIFSEPVRKQATDLLKPYIGENDVVVTIAVAGAVFLVVLIVLSIIGAKISDALLETGAGPIDRTLGFFYGLARGLVLMMAVFIFYVWLVPRDKIDNAVRDAMTLPLVTSVSSFAVDTLLTVGLMGPDLADDLQAKIGNPSTLSTRGDAEAPSPGAPQQGEAETGYRSNQTNTLNQIIESTQGTQ